MTLRVRRILTQVGITLQDQTAVRWSLRERYRYLEDGVRELAIHNPAALTRTRIMGLAAGSRQEAPDGVLSIHAITANMAGLSNTYERRDSITTVERAVIDATDPDWANPNKNPAQKRVLHVIYDEIDPRTFHVYPPNDGTGRVEYIAAVMPYIPSPPDSATNQLISWDGVQINRVPDIYENAIADYILFRCYEKDTQFTGNAARAQAHFMLFANAVGMKNAKEIALSINALGAPAVNRRSPDGAQ